jgi:hypothetical protein
MPGAQRQCIQIVLLRASGMMQLVLLRATARRARRGPTRVIVCQCVLHRSDDARARPSFEIFLKTLAQKCLPATHPAAPGPWQQNLWDEIREKIFENCAAQIHERRLLPSLSKPHLRSNILPIVKSVTSFPGWSHRSDYKEAHIGLIIKQCFAPQEPIKPTARAHSVELCCRWVEASKGDQIGSRGVPSYDCAPV